MAWTPVPMNPTKKGPICVPFFLDYRVVLRNPLQLDNNWSWKRIHAVMQQQARKLFPLHWSQNHPWVPQGPLYLLFYHYMKVQKEE